MTKSNSNKLTLSYSKLAQYDECPASYYLQHVLHCEDEENFYSQYGTLVHDVLRNVFSGKLDWKNAPKEYMKRYDAEVTLPFPEGLKGSTESYFFDGLAYLEQDTQPFRNAKVIEVENKFSIDMGEYTLNGILDLLLSQDGALVLVDHKSSSRKQFYGVSLAAKLRQLYLYCEYVSRQYGVLPKKLIFNCFRDNKLVERQFDPREFDDAIFWANETAKDIAYMTKRYAKDESKWPVNNRSVMFCRNVCGMRFCCSEALTF